MARILAICGLAICIAALVRLLGIGPTGAALYAIVAASVGLWATAAVVPAIASGAPPRLRNTAGNAAWGVLHAVVGFLVGVLATMFVPDAAWWVPATASLSVGALVLFLATVMWFVPLRPVFALDVELADPARKEAALARLHTACANAAAGTGWYDRRLLRQLVLTAVAVLAEKRLYRDVLVLAALIPPSGPSIWTVMLQSSRAVALLYTHDLPAARHAIESAKAAGPTGVMKDAVTIHEALYLGLAGDGAGALAALSRMREPADARMRRGYLIAAANAHAAVGDERGAREALEHLRAAHGDEGMARVRELAGPAAALLA